METLHNPKVRVRTPSTVPDSMQDGILGQVADLFSAFLSLEYLTLGKVGLYVFSLEYLTLGKVGLYILVWQGCICTMATFLYTNAKYFLPEQGYMHCVCRIFLVLSETNHDAMGKR